MTTKRVGWGSASAAVKGAGAGAAAFVPRQLAAPAAGGRPLVRRPPTIARGEGSCAVPETLTSSLGRSCQRPGPQSWAHPFPARGRDAPLGAATEPKPEKGARGGSAHSFCGRGKLRAGPWPRGWLQHWSAEASLPWGRRPPPIHRPRFGTGATWTAASPATASASPSACGSAPPPAGSPPTRCNGARDLAAPGWGRVGRGGNGNSLPRQLTPCGKT